MKAFLYVRVSTKEQVEGYSISEQQERLKAYAKARGYTVIKTYVDPGHSGANIDRPALQEMMKEIKNADIVLVYKLDRLSRSQRDTLYLIEEVFLKNNVDFNSVSESFDTSTPFGRAMIGILSVFAQLEREQIRERLEIGRIARAKDGYYHGGDPERTMAGYDYVEGLLLINEYEAECVKYIFNEYLNGKGAARIFDDIQEKYPGVIAHSSTIRKILIRPVYKGVVVFAGKEYKGRHEPIISEKDFDDVQRLIKKRSEKFDSTPDSPYILSGLLRCGHCNARMAGKAGKRLASGETMKYYVCYTRRKSPKHMMTADSCDKSFERKERLEESVINELKKLKLSDVEKITGKADDNKKQTLIDQVEVIKNQISKLVDLFSLGTISMDVLNAKIDTLNADKDKLEQYIEELESSESAADLSVLKEVIPQLSDIEDLPLKEQQLIIVRLVDGITVNDNEVIIDWAF